MTEHPSYAFQKLAKLVPYVLYSQSEFLLSHDQDWWNVLLTELATVGGTMTMDELTIRAKHRHEINTRHTTGRKKWDICDNTADCANSISAMHGTDTSRLHTAYIYRAAIPSTVQTRIHLKLRRFGSGQELGWKPTRKAGLLLEEMLVWPKQGAPPYGLCGSQCSDK